MDLTAEDFDIAPARFPSRTRSTATQERPNLDLNISQERPIMRSDAMTPEVAGQARQHLADLNTATRDMVFADDDMESSDLEDEERTDAPNETNALELRQTTNDLISKTDIKWYPTNNLPGIPKPIIRKMGQEIFSQYTNAPLSQIHAIATVVNPEADVAKVYKVLQDKGQKVDDVSYDFEQVMPGYQAEASIYKFKNREFLLVKDFAGYYVYSWSSETSLLNTDQKSMIESLHAKYFRRI